MKNSNDTVGNRTRDLPATEYSKIGSSVQRRNLYGKGYLN